MSKRRLRIGHSERIYQPEVGATGLRSKSLQYIEQSVAHWFISREVMVLTIPSACGDGIVHRSCHEIVWDGRCGLAKLYPGATGGSGVSIHHQSIKALGRGLQIEARSADEIVEAIRLEGKLYVFGVQWHPEFHPPGSPDLLDCTPILDEFLNAERGRRW